MARAKIFTRAYVITVKDEFDVPKRHHQHDCKRCKFVGNMHIGTRTKKTEWQWHVEDLYLCGKDSITLVRRRSDEGSDYGSMPLSCIEINARNPEPASYASVVKKLQEDKIIKVKFELDTKARGFTCFHCKKKIRTNHKKYEQFPFCDSICKEEYDIHFANLMKGDDND